MKLCVSVCLWSFFSFVCSMWMWMFYMHSSRIRMTHCSAKLIKYIYATLHGGDINYCLVSNITGYNLLARSRKPHTNPHTHTHMNKYPANSQYAMQYTMAIGEYPSRILENFPIRHWKWEIIQLLKLSSFFRDDFEVN